MHDIPITGDMIRLGQLLKLAGAVDSAGRAPHPRGRSGDRQ